MIVSQTDLDLILNARIRKRTIAVPVLRGALSERKRPPRVGAVLTLQAPSRYGALCARAQAEQPTRARAVLWAMERARPTRPLIVTVTHVELQGAVYAVTFVLGNHHDDVTADKPVYLEQGAGYTRSPARAVRGAGEVMLDPHASERARVLAQLHRARPQAERAEELIFAAGALREAIASMRARNALRRAERNLADVVRILSEEAVLSGQAPPQLGTRGEAADLFCGAPSPSPEIPEAA